MKVNEEILKACVSGNEIAQKQLYEECFSFLIGICKRYTKSDDEAMLYLNIGFFKILTVIGQFKGNGNFLSWARRVMINVIIDEIRKNKKYKSHVILLEEAEMQWRVESTQNWFDVQAVSEEEIYYYIAELPVLTASVFNLFAIDGYSHQEIANKLGIGLSASKWHYASAKKKLQKRVLEKMKIIKKNER